uniref:Uncharacterized protein n=1 Tax=Oncorhynchus mykiss TaxID=8022 RepID=A0A8K9XL22_ONCMY
MHSPVNVILSVCEWTDKYLFIPELRTSALPKSLSVVAVRRVMNCKHVRRSLRVPINTTLCVKLSTRHEQLLRETPSCYDSELLS